MEWGFDAETKDNHEFHKSIGLKQILLVTRVITPLTSGGQAPIKYI